MFKHSSREAGSAVLWGGLPGVPGPVSDWEAWGLSDPVLMVLRPRPQEEEEGGAEGSGGEDVMEERLKHPEIGGYAT